MRLEEEILQDSFQSECHRAIVNIFYTYHYHSQAFWHHNAAIQHSTRGQQSQPIGIQDIQRRMLDKSSDVSRLVDRLVHRGLATRTNSQIDRRRKEVAITAKGLQLLERIDPKIQAMEQTCQTLSDREVRQLNKLLDKLRG